MSNSLIKYTITNSGSRISDGFLFWQLNTPTAIALNINGKNFTYEQVFNKSKSIYNQIKDLSDEVIGLQCISELDSYAAILAISYLGASYLPLNIKFPEIKLKEIVGDASLKTVLCFNEEFVFLNESTDLIMIQDNIENIDESIDLKNNSNLCYVLYTSGSTGKPKGVPISRNNLNSFFNYFLSEYDFNSTDRFLQPYELSFDVSVFSIFCAWNVGASVYVVPDSSAKHLDIIKTITKHNITVASMVPIVINLLEKYFSEFHFPSIRYSFFSGDALKQSVVKKWKSCLPNGEVHNFYGPTETTIVCTRYVWNEVDAETESVNNIVPIGKPFHLNTYLVISEVGNVITNDDAPGELCLEGAQVISNYLNNEFEDSFVVIDGKRYYKTGDRVSVNKSGQLIFIGRLDSQAKIGGYRVELIEVENAIIKVCGLVNKVIVNELNQLIAFVESDSELDLRKNLSKLLPAYKIPTRFIFLKSLPLNTNGKVDFQKLKEHRKVNYLN